ncbi:MAG: ThuA domain-containing protein [Phycisphaerales bacterium]|nr:MAG: ThuA domain-containing protein [Phycisphaerales bacterium]
MRRRIFVPLVLSACVTLVLGFSRVGRPHVLIIQDELPQMEVLAKFLREVGKLSVTIVDQKSLPDDLSRYEAVIVFIHRELLEKTEMAIIEYTKNGGRLVCLHHSISSRKALNKFYFDFLGMQLDKGPAETGGYKWKAGSYSLINLNSKHFITNSGVDWNERIAYTPSDYPSSQREYPGITLGADSEVFLNHKFTDGREKTVLCGIVYHDPESGRTYMQDRGTWVKKQGKGTIVYFLPGHAVSDYENKNISQIILNSITWSPN